MDRSTSWQEQGFFDAGRSHRGPPPDYAERIVLDPGIGLGQTRNRASPRSPRFAEPAANSAQTAAMGLSRDTETFHRLHSSRRNRRAIGRLNRRQCARRGSPAPRSCVCTQWPETVQGALRVLDAVREGALRRRGAAQGRRRNIAACPRATLDERRPSCVTAGCDV